MLQLVLQIITCEVMREPRGAQLADEVDKLTNGWACLGERPKGQPHEIRWTTRKDLPECPATGASYSGRSRAQGSQWQTAHRAPPAAAYHPACRPDRHFDQVDVFRVISHLL